MNDITKDAQSPVNLRAVIFDMGGVLMRTVDQEPRRMLAARLGVILNELYDQIFSSESARLATLGKISTQEHWEQVRSHFGISPDEFPKAIQQFWEGDLLDQSLLRYLGTLRERYKVALLSNAWDNMRDILENEWKIASDFDEVIISAEIGLAKPDHRIYQLTLSRLGVGADEAVFVDDFVENVDAARWLGMRAIHFRSPDQARAELERMLNT